MIIMEYIPLNKIKTDVFRPRNKLQDTIPKKTELYTSCKHNMWKKLLKGLPLV